MTLFGIFRERNEMYRANFTIYMYFRLLLQYNLRVAVGSDLLYFEWSMIEYFLLDNPFARLDDYRDEYCFFKQHLHNATPK